jgi:ABC-type uncharacterized transport system auxiliary subunit
MNVRTVSAPGLVLLAVLASGCLSLIPKVPQPRDYRIDYPSPVIQHSPIPVVLRVAPVRVAALYDREPFAYAQGPYRVGYRYYHRWATAPGQMLTDLLVRDFSQSGLYRSVQQGASVLVADYQLDVRIDRFEQELLGDRCAAAVVAHASLQRLRPGMDNPVRLQRTYKESEPIDCEAPEDFVRGMSRAIARISEHLQEDVYAAVQATEQEAAPQTSL